MFIGVGIPWSFYKNRSFCNLRPVFFYFRQNLVLKIQHVFFFETSEKNLFFFLFGFGIYVQERLIPNPMRKK